jgi:prevent-host-death family protein
MQQFTVPEARSNLSKLLDMALEGEEVVISRHGAPVARLTPVRTESGARIPGAGRGTVTFINDDWNKAMPDEEADAFWVGHW